MPYRQPSEIQAEANSLGLRRALVVVAIQIEMRAVLPHLVNVESSIGKHGIVYECGCLPDPAGDWLVVVAQSGPGNLPAHRIITTAHLDFGSFDLQLFVGIAGSLKQDVPIGSVVAGERVYNAHSGKADTEFVARPHSVNTTVGLVQAAHKVSRDSLWQQRIRPPLKSSLPAQDSYPCPFPPESFVGAVAAGEQVLASDTNAFYAQIKTHLSDAYVVEMEGYGAMFGTDGVEGTPAIIIRGVSDMCFGKTAVEDKLKQPIAAAHAAAFAFELIAFWGVAQPQKALSPPPAAVETQATVPSQTAPRVTVVLSFEGDGADFPTGKVDQILQALKVLTNDSALAITSTEIGSFHIFLAARLQDVAVLCDDSLRREIAKRCGVSLIGATTEEEYRAAGAYRTSLANPSQELQSWPRELPNGTWIERPELTSVLSKIKDDDTSVVALLGAPGSGKSALLATLCNTLENDQVPFLAIKADVLSPSVETEGQLRVQLGLPSNPSTIIESLAHRGPVVLIIDQLDALASFMDLKTGRLNVLLNMIRRLGGRPNIHVVLSARTFEYEHDVRLRSVAAESIALQLPPWHVVLKILETENIEAENWPEDAREVLRHPQALKTLLSLKSSGEPEAFRTYQAMLDRLWSERVLAGVNGPARAQLAADIAEAMSDDETLWLGAARYDDRPELLNELIAAGIITKSQTGESIGFRHQTLFDHALARTFVKQRGRLSSYVLQRQPSLFIRPKLWAALTYLRAVEPRAYEAELRAIWNTQNLRKHLRILLLDFLGQQAWPFDFEEQLILPLLLSGELRPIGFRAISGSPGWFKRLGHSAISAAMNESVDSARLALEALSAAWSFAPDSVLALVEKCWLPHPEFDTFTWFALDDSTIWDERTRSIAKTIIERTPIAAMRVDHLAGSIAVNNPEIALAIVKSKLDRELAELVASQEQIPPYPEHGTYDEQVSWHIRHDPGKRFERYLEDTSGWNSLPDIGEAAPGILLAALWPWYRSIFDELAKADTHERNVGFSVPYKIDWYFDASGGETGRTEAPLLAAIRVAVELTATSDPDYFLQWAEANKAVPITPVQRLIAHGLQTNAERFADYALRFLIEDTERFHLGNIRDSRGTTKALIAAASNYWNDGQIAALEKSIMNYTLPTPDNITDAAEKRQFLKTMRSVRLELLKELPLERLSEAAQKLVNEESRVFPRVGSGATFQGGYIGSPMDSDAMRKASDADILRIFSEIPDSAGWDHPRDWMRGGNVQLSRAFADFVKSNLVRGAQIMRQFEVGLQERAAGYAIDAIAEQAEPAFVVDLIFEMTQKKFDTSEFRWSVASGIEKLLNRKYVADENVVQLLERWLASKAADTESDEKDSQSDTAESDEADDNVGAAKEEERARSILWDNGGFSILPHGSYPVLAALIRILLLRGEGHRERLLKILDAHLERENDAKIWRATLHFLDYIDAKHVVDFVRRLFDRVPDLSATNEGVRTLARMFWNAPEFVKETIQSWPSSKNSRTRVAYGELVALIAIVKPEQKWACDAVDVAISGNSDEVRTGITFACVNLWNEPLDRKSRAADYLVQIMPYASVETWRAVFDVFRIVDELVPDAPTVKFLRALAGYESCFKAMPSHFVVQRLQTILPHHAELIGAIAHSLVNSWKSDLGDIGTASSASANELVDLAVTLHRLGGATREMGTSLFESLIALNAYGARETLDEIDSRFRGGGRRSRPRVARSKRRRAPNRLMRAGRS